MACQHKTDPSGCCQRCSSISEGTDNPRNSAEDRECIDHAIGNVAQLCSDQASGIAGMCLGSSRKMEVTVGTFYRADKKTWHDESTGQSLAVITSSKSDCNCICCFSLLAPELNRKENSEP